jgi:hypothetical protein
MDPAQRCRLSLTSPRASCRLGRTGAWPSPRTPRTKRQRAHQWGWTAKARLATAASPRSQRPAHARSSGCPCGAGRVQDLVGHRLGLGDHDHVGALDLDDVGAARGAIERTTSVPAGRTQLPDRAGRGDGCGVHDRSPSLPRGVCRRSAGRASGPDGGYPAASRRVGVQRAERPAGLEDAAVLGGGRQGRVENAVLLRTPASICLTGPNEVLDEAWEVETAIGAPD